MMLVTSTKTSHQFVLSLQGHREKSKSRTTGQKVVTPHCPPRKVCAPKAHTLLFAGDRCGTSLWPVVRLFDVSRVGSLQGQHKLVRLFRRCYDFSTEQYQSYRSHNGWDNALTLISQVRNFLACHRLMSFTTYKRTVCIADPSPTFKIQMPKNPDSYLSRFLNTVGTAFRMPL